MATIIKKLILKSKSNYGDLAKQHIVLLNDDGEFFLHFERLFLVDKSDDQTGKGIGDIVKTFRNKNLHMLGYATKLNSFSTIIEWLANAEDNTLTKIHLD